MSSFLLTFDILNQGAGYIGSPVQGVAVTFWNVDADAAVSPDPGLTSDVHGAISQPVLNVAAGTRIRAKAIYRGMANYFEGTTQ